jgi:hypothetical protein
LQEKTSIEEKILKTNGTKNTQEKKVADDNEDTIVFKKFEDETNGKKMTSVKPAESFEDVTRMAKDTELVSGRQAGQRWHSSGIRFAPLNVPLQRRLQTLTVLFHTLCIALSVSAFFFLCAIPLFWPLLIPYMIYCMASKASTDGTLSHRSDYPFGRYLLLTFLLGYIELRSSLLPGNTSLDITHTGLSLMVRLRPLERKRWGSHNCSRESKIRFSPWTPISESLSTGIMRWQWG